MHPGLLVKALAAMEPETTLQQFQSTSGIESRSVAKSVLDFLALKGIVTISRNKIKFGVTGRLHTAMLALQSGCDIEQVSGHLSWKDFEKISSSVLASFGYRTSTNVWLTKPRMEIDVVGTSSGFAIVVDCKHWKKSSSSSIATFAKKQAARAEHLLNQDKTISRAVPVIMTLHASSVRFVGGVPIVPVQKFKSFVMEVEGFLPEIYVAR